ncbi:MAG: hypothetical protein EBS11_27360 [Janthinobacterium sp.]|nr:hypothetical protein [Janthinobacterium sp.]
MLELPADVQQALYVVRFGDSMARPMACVTQIDSVCSGFLRRAFSAMAARRRVFRLKRARQC